MRFIAKKAQGCCIENFLSKFSDLARKTAYAFSKLDQISRKAAVLGMSAVMKDDSCFNSKEKLSKRSVYHYQLVTKHAVLLQGGNQSMEKAGNICL